MDFSNDSKCSTPFSTDAATMQALGGSLVYFKSISSLVFFRDQACFSIVFFVNMNSSSWTILLWLSIAIWTPYLKSAAYMKMSIFWSSVGSLVFLMTFFLTMFSWYNFLSWYNVILLLGYFRWNS